MPVHVTPLQMHHAQSPFLLSDLKVQFPIHYLQKTASLFQNKSPRYDSALSKRYQASACKDMSMIFQAFTLCLYTHIVQTVVIGIGDNKNGPSALVLANLFVSTERLGSRKISRAN